MDTDGAMYYWQRMTCEQREAVLKERKQHPRPWHGPPHYVAESGLYLFSAACYDHRSIIGASPQRMADFESELLATTEELSQAVFAWIVLPNHYHLLVQTTSIDELLEALGQMHGRTSFRWNGKKAAAGDRFGTGLLRPR
jgi:putative transposase